MLDVLQKHLLSTPSLKGCVVSTWILNLTEEEKTVIALLKESKTTVIVDLYRDLIANSELPFKLTAFRSHMKGYCTCPTN